MAVAARVLNCFFIEIPFVIFGFSDKIHDLISFRVLF